MDAIDRKLLRQAQKGLTMTSRPFQVLAEETGISEDEVIERLTSLKQRGILRRLGGVFEARKLGYVSALCALQVDQDEADRIAQLINGYSGVTHNYLRDHPILNLWFTLTCASNSEFTATIEQIETSIAKKIHIFPVLRRYKIKFYLPLEDTGCE